MLMKKAFEAGRIKQFIAGVAINKIHVHGNFKDFLHKNNYVAGRLYITPYIVKVIPI